jgi:hypothetical protein
MIIIETGTGLLRFQRDFAKLSLPTWFDTYDAGTKDGCCV